MLAWILEDAGLAPGFLIGGVFLDSQYLLIMVVTLVLVAFNFWFFERTLLGKKLQATSQDKEMASLLGIPVATMIMLTFVYSALLGGVAGILVAPILFVSIQMGSTIAIGLLVDTFIVRSLLMPSIATLLGRWFWWPQVVYPRGDNHFRKPQPTTPPPTADDADTASLPAHG